MQLFGTEEKSCNLSGQKKSHNLSGQKKITQPLGTKKNQTTSWDQKYPKNSILVTNEIQEIGTDHLGLVQFTQQPWTSFHLKASFQEKCRPIKLPTSIC